MYLLGISIQTTGRSLTKHRLVAIGACLVNVTYFDVTEPRDKHIFRAILAIPDVENQKHLWEERYYNEFWNYPDITDAKKPIDMLYDLAQKHQQEEPVQAMERFWEWISYILLLYPTTRIISDNVGYVVSWINFYLSKYLDTKDTFHLLEYAQETYKPVLCIHDYYIGRSHFTPIENVKYVSLEVLYKFKKSIDSFPEKILAIEHDYDPVNESLSMTLKAAFVTQLGMLDKMILY